MRFIKTLNLLSIDVALGAAVSAAFFARIFNVIVLPQGYILLALIVWLIYTADHLLDAWSMKQAATTERHLFHQKYFLTILICFLVGGLVAIALMFLIRVQLITTGIVLGTFVIFYLVVNRWLKYFKEVVGTALYTVGVVLPAWSVNTNGLFVHQIFLVIQFALVALTNMLIFAALSREQDIQNQQSSLATIVGDGTMKWFIGIIGLFCLASVISILVIYKMPESIVLLAMEVTLLTISQVKYFRYNDRYRIYGDAVFLFPIVLLI